MSQFGRDLDNFSACRTVRIIGSECVENYTVYIIEVTIGPYTWTVKHRYSDFHDLHDKLVSTFKIDKSLLPPKKLFGNQSEAFIKKRQNDLEVYLQTILYYLAQKIPPILAYFLDFHKYEIHGITQALAEDLYNRGELILQAKEPFQMTTLHLYALTERLKLPEPTCGFTLLFPDSGDVKKDIGHILDFITRLKHLKICGSRDPVGSSNIDMNELRFDLTLFKSLQTLEILNCNSMLITGFETIKQTLQKIEAHHSMKEIKDLLLQEFSHWRDEDGTLIVAFWNHIIEADLGHNNIKSIDESVQLLPRVEHLDLSHNQIDTIQNLQWLSQLTFLDLSHNNIHQLDSLHTKLGNLKTLNLAGNRIRHLQGLSKLFSLVNLDISNNDISEINEVKHISGLPCMEKLSLIGNSVTIVLDYRTKVLAMFSDRANEIYLDNMKPSQKELDTVAVVLALQKSKENKEKLRKMMPNKHASDMDCASRDSSPRNPTLITAPPLSSTMTTSSSSSSTPPVASSPPAGLVLPSSVTNATETGGDSLPTPPLPGLEQNKEIAQKRTLLSLAEHSSLLANSLSQHQRLAVAKNEDREDAVANTQNIRQSSNDKEEICTGSSNLLDQPEQIGQSQHIDKSLQTGQPVSTNHFLPNDQTDKQIDQPLSTVQQTNYSLPTDPQAKQPISCEQQTDQQPLKINQPLLTDPASNSSLKYCGFLSHFTHNSDKKHQYRPKDLHQKAHNFVYKYEHLPSTLNQNFCHSLISNLIGSTSSDSECVEHLFWSYSLQYTHPNVISPACVVLTQKHIFIQHLQGYSTNFPGVPQTITYYILPLCNVQQVLVSCNFIQLEESFVGPSGIFLLYAVESSQVRKVSDALIKCYKDNPEHGEPEIVQATNQQQLLSLIEEAEQKEGFYSVEISFTAVVISDGHFCTLALSENYLYLLKINHFQSSYPPPPGECEKGGDAILSARPIMASRNISFKWRENGKHCHLPEHMDTVRYELFPLSMEFGNQDKDEECLVVHFLGSTTRDEYLEKFTTLRSQNSDRLSLVARQEPEGANEDNDVEINKPAASPMSNQSTPINKDFLTINYNSNSANNTTASTPETETSERLRNYQEIRRPSFTPPCEEQLNYLTKCNQSYKLVKDRSACLEALGKMDGWELVEYFHLNIAHIGYDCEEMLYVVWADVVPYKNPDQVITSLVVLTSKAVYCISDAKVEIPPKIKRMWMTHCRHKSDSAIATLQSGLQNEAHHCAGILHRGGCQHAKVPRAFIIIPLSQLVQINIGMFDQCLRLTGPNEDSVCTIVTRECAATETFLQVISSALSSHVVTSADTPSDSEVDFYSLVTKIRSNTEGIEYVHPSKVHFCYPGEETISDIMYIISDISKENLSSKTPYLIWVYILGFQIPVESADLAEAVTKASPRTVILTNQHFCLAAEDLVSYPLPEFARGLPDKPRHRILEVRKIEYLKRILVEQEPHKCLTLVFSDEDDEIEVDTSFEYYSPKEDLKGRKSPPEVSLRLLFQYGKEEAKLLQMLKRQWGEIHLADELPVHMMA